MAVKLNLEQKSFTFYPNDENPAYYMAVKLYLEQKSFTFHPNDEKYRKVLK